VLIASTFSDTTGFAWAFIFRLQRAVADAVRARGCDVVLSFAEIEGKPDAPVARFDILRASPVQVVAFARWLRARGVRYVYATDWPSRHLAYAVLRLFGVRRIVVHVHSSVVEPQRSPAARGVARFAKGLLQRTPLAADAMIAVSDFVAYRLTQVGCYPAARVTTIHNGVDVDAFRCQERAPAGPPLRIFMAGRATRYKGVQVLIEAVGRLRGRPELPAFVVEFAGDGPDLAWFKELARARGVDAVFTFLGQVADTRSHVCASDIVVVPSVWGEAFGLTVAEGMAAGRAVVASRAGGIPEVTGEDGAAVLVPPGDPDALAEAIAGLLADPARRQAMGRLARQRVEQEFQEAECRDAVASAVLDGFDMA